MKVLTEPFAQREDDGRPVHGVVCAHCEGELFSIFVVAGQSHVHYVCINCHVTFCGTWNKMSCDEFEKKTTIPPIIPFNPSQHGN